MAIRWWGGLRWQPLKSISLNQSDGNRFDCPTLEVRAMSKRIFSKPDTLLYFMAMSTSFVGYPQLSQASSVWTTSNEGDHEARLTSKLPNVSG